MGSCCSRKENDAISSRRNSLAGRRSSIILDRYIKVTNYKKKYEYISMLGNGGFGKVRLYRDKSCKDLKVAVKTLKKDSLNSKNLASIEDEVKILRDMDHPNIVKYFETYEDECYIHIVMEYIPGDNLFKVITNRKYNHFCERDAAEILTCLFKAVLFLHKNEVVHRDIKPENILFSFPGKYQSLKLIDFGLSINNSNNQDKYRVGSPYYMAPEMLDGNSTPATDVWSIGVILYVMMTGSHPFKGKKQEDVFERIRKGVYDKKLLDKQKCSNYVKDLIKKLLVLDPRRRLTIDTALEHPWITQHKDSLDVHKIDEGILDSLRSFINNDPLQKETLFYIAKISSEHEIEKLKQAFLEIDKDNTGTIEKEEVIGIYEKLGIKTDEDEVKEIWKGLDFHNDGKVNYSEFLAATLSSVQFFKEEKLWSAFKYFDIHDTGYITSQSVIEVLKSSDVPVNESGLTEVFNSLDKNNKRLNFEEFKKIFMKNKPSIKEILKTGRQK